MFKTLASLALAMTVGAGLLAWLEPRPANYAGDAALAGNPLLTRHLARQVVRSSGLSDSRIWRGVEIVTLAGTRQTAGGTLTASVPPENLHFVVGEDGGLRALPAWLQERDSASSTKMIRVGVVARRSDRRVPTSQWLTLRALLAELGEQTQAASLPVRLEPQADVDSGDAPPLRQHLHTLLVKDGLLG